MQYVLVSACLLGSPVRYDGSHKRSASEILQRWSNEGRIIAICPEVAGGLPVPRPPAEIVGDAGGAGVLMGPARVFDATANDLSTAFVNGARHALDLTRSRHVRLAVLKEASPSCGSRWIYDGTFTGKRMRGTGVTAALLASAGVRVFSEEQFGQACSYLRSIEARSLAL